MFFNKYIALVIVLIILIIGYFLVARRGESLKPRKAKGRKAKGRRGKRGKSSAPAAKNSRRSRSDDDDSADDSAASDDDDSEDDKLGGDAEELYNLVHEALCKGMQQDEFEEVAGELAGPLAFIELKQLYNQCIDKKMDPMRAVTVEDYIRILRKEDGGT